MWWKITDVFTGPLQNVLFFIIIYLLQRENLKIRLCLTEELEPMFVTSIPTRPSEIERCRIERFIFAHYRSHVVSIRVKRTPVK